MRKRLIGLLILGLLIVGVPATASAATPGDFEGDWTATDGLDGSSEEMTITQLGSSGRLRVVLHDDGGSFCLADPLVPLVARGVGSVSGDDLTVNLKVKCANGVKGRATVTFHFDGTHLQDGNAASPGWERIP